MAFTKPSSLTYNKGILTISKVTMEAIYVKNNLNQFSKPQKKLSKTLLSVGSTAALSVFGISLLIFKKAFGRGEPTKEQFPKDPRIHRSRLWLKHTRHEHVYTTSTDGLKLHGVIYNPYHRSDPPTNPGDHALYSRLSFRRSR